MCCLCGRGHIKGITCATFSLPTMIDFMNEVRGFKTFQKDLEILAKMVSPTTTFTNITTHLLIVCGMSTHDFMHIVQHGAGVVAL